MIGIFGTSGLGATAADPMVKLVQDSLNQVLAGMKCRGIGADGRLGPETCGAIAHVLDNQSKLPVTSALINVQSNGVAMLNRCTGTSYRCGGAATTAVPPPSTTTAAAAATAYTPPRGMSTANKVMLGAGLIAVAVVGFAVAKKKGWVG
jgi:hypothetical protein